MVKDINALTISQIQVNVMKAFKINGFDLFFENASVPLMKEFIKGVFANATCDDDGHTITCTLKTPITVESCNLSAAYSCVLVIGQKIGNIFGCRFVGANLIIHPINTVDT